MIAKKTEEFTQCLQEGRYYDAHEVLEEVWYPRRFEESAEVKLLKGFINAAVSFELHKKGRIPQSKKVWANYLKYRPQLFQTNSPHQNNYYQLSRYLEGLYKKNLKRNLKKSIDFNGKCCYHFKNKGANKQ